ncbi:cardiolipin synthase [Ectobacillus antri]|jgi:cardiolipin synthase|uniref:Cardiolipin synthase n=1 Tax=Ectobacillus antri TaxID=2486280 RepID=A0ABT6H5P1_9BACI|nr:cardiolipin synthase [Ectobacillus antri]MDG4657657.1 cardiolipin synthase [Ectobacillus antri]MDG5754664.1 cardiolipin synthase [Ectobacillus antri]
MRYILLFLVLVVVWITLDLKLGRRAQVRRAKSRSFPYRYSDFELYTYGQTLYDQLFLDIRQAQQHIHILFFIVNNDEVSQKFLRILKEKAEEGVEVRLLLDRIGSHHLSKASIQALRASGVHFSFCHNPCFPYLLYSINQRNHRKITIIDGSIGYIGGFNIGEEYLGHDPKLGKWRDYHLRVVGEGVQDLQMQFLHDWRDETREDLTKEDTYFPPLQKGKTKHRFIPTDGTYLQHTFLELIQEAQHDLYIGTPYFIPGRKLLRELIAAAKRGVRVTILVPERADHPLVKEAKLPYFRELLRAGCVIYEFTDGFFHAKIVTVDGRICDIGTANFDLRSLYINHEINCIMYDSPFLETVKKEVDQDLENSRLLSLTDISNPTFWQRCKEWFASIIAFFL